MLKVQHDKFLESGTHAFGYLQESNQHTPDKRERVRYQHPWIDPITKRRPAAPLYSHTGPNTSKLDPDLDPNSTLSCPNGVAFHINRGRSGDV